VRGDGHTGSRFSTWPAGASSRAISAGPHVVAVEAGALAPGLHRLRVRAGGLAAERVLIRIR